MLAQTQLKRLGWPMSLAPTGAAVASTTAPDAVSNLLLWLDGSDTSTLHQNSDGSGAVASNADPIGKWDDKSGNGIHFTQAMADNRPTWNSAGAVDLAGTDWLTNATISQPASDYTFIVGVDLAANNENDEYLIDITSGRLTLGFAHSGANTYQLFDGTWKAFDAIATGKQVLVWRLDSSDKARLYKDGAESATSWAYSKVALGGAFALGGIYLNQALFVPNVDIYQICAYARALSDAEVNGVATWVADTVGVTWGNL